MLLSMGALMMAWGGDSGGIQSRCSAEERRRGGGEGGGRGKGGSTGIEERGKVAEAGVGHALPGEA